MLHAARWKCRTQKIAKNSPHGHKRTTLSGYTFITKARIDNRKKLVKQQCLPHMSSQHGELRPTSGSDLLARLGHPSKYLGVSCLGNVTARHSSGVSQSLRRWTEDATYIRKGGHHVWALAHILVLYCISGTVDDWTEKLIS